MTLYLRIKLGVWSVTETSSIETRPAAYGLRQRRRATCNYQSVVWPAKFYDTSTLGPRTAAARFQ